MFMTRSGRPLMLVESENMFDDSSDKQLDDKTLQSKYMQINKNLQGIISFCANKLGSNYTQDEISTEVNSFGDDRPETSFSQTTFLVDNDAVEGQWRYQLPCEQKPSYNSGSPQRAPEKSSFVKQNGYPQNRGEQKVAEMFNDVTAPADPNLNDFRDLIQDFILAKTDEKMKTGGGSRRLQIRRVNEVEVRSTPEKESSNGNDRSLVQKQFGAPESSSDQGPRFNPLGKQTLLSKYRNLVSGNIGSPFTPLKCAKCQLEMSKRELETLGKELNHMQGYHDCGNSGHYCCAGDDSSSIGQWECTCGQTPGSRTRELHRQEKQQDSNKSLVNSKHTNSTSINCAQVQVYTPNHNFINFGGCCCRSDMVRHGGCGIPVNFLRHEDTHGKCKDCYRRENLNDAFKLKHIIDKQYEKQMLSRWKERRDKEVGNLLGRFPRDRSEVRTGEPGGSRNQNHLHPQSRFGSSDPALIVELDRSSGSVAANASETIVVDDGGNQRKLPRTTESEYSNFSVESER